MNPTTSIGNTRDTVIELLQKMPGLRDNDNRLIANMWHREVKGMDKDIAKMTGFDFLQIFAEGKLSHPETIRRTRQKVQEERTELRGTRYVERQAEGEETRKTISKNY